MAVAPKRNGLFSAIANRDDALKVVKDSSSAFFFLAAIEAALGLFIPRATSTDLLLDALAYLVLGAILRKWHSRIAAVILLLAAIGSGAVTLLNNVGITSAPGTNVGLAIAVLVVAARAVEATFKLHGRFAVPTVGSV